MVRIATAGWLIAGTLLVASACGRNTDLFGTAASAAGGAGSGGDGSGASSSTNDSTSTNSTSTNQTGTTATTTTPNMCGNGVCDPGETSANCPGDCPAECTHSVCQYGEPLVPGCDPCVTDVCNADAFCCNDTWDDQCIAAADAMCGSGCCGNGMCEGQNCSTCPADCGECVCGDGECLGEDCGSCPVDCGQCATCGHSTCVAGTPLSLTDCKDPCVTEVCDEEPSCCTDPPWSVSCQQSGDQLCPGPNPCVEAVCSLSAECCTSAWNAGCVALAQTQCSTSCNCAHDICDGGAALEEGCDPCVAAICEADAYCCESDWDGICINEVASVCGIVCP